MSTKLRAVTEILIENAMELHRRPRQVITFSNNPRADALLNCIEEFPHFFVLGCIMDRQIKAWRAWMIPYRISEIIGGTEFQKYLSLDLSTTKRIFIQHSLHRMPSQMAYCHFKAVEKIHLDYHDDASLIWKRDDPTSADVIKRFSEFYGVGQKISTMAANILVREFKIDLIDKSAIDISVDVHIERVFKRIGFVPKDATRNDIINLARELYPEYPGIFDSVCWEIGEAWCRPNSPLCENCILKGLCASYQTRSHKKDD